MRKKDKLFQELRDLGYPEAFILDLDERGITISSIQEIIKTTNEPNTLMEEIESNYLLSSDYFGGLAQCILLIKDPKDYLKYFINSRELPNKEDFLEDLTIVLMDIFPKENYVAPKFPIVSEDTDIHWLLEKYHKVYFPYQIDINEFREANQKIIELAKNCYDINKNKFLENIENE